MISVKWQRALRLAIVSAAVLAAWPTATPAVAQTATLDAGAHAPIVSVAPQYTTAHVYVPGQALDAFVTSLIQTFGGHASSRVVLTVTPTPSTTLSQYVQTPVGMLSVFAFQTPVPYPFGSERTGYLVTDIETAVRAARAAGADVTVGTFDDPLGKDAVIQWPGGVTMQLYWHTKAPSYAPLETVPDNRVYLSPYAADTFLERFLRFSHGTIVSDDRRADGGEIGRPGERIRRVRIQSGFGNLLAFVTDGHLPYPYGREVMGYQVPNLDATLAKARGAGVTVLSEPVASADGRTAMVEFPGGYVAEVHERTR
ncbi:VOC family protein [Burkholderia guangdongensis]|uniref:VOC family protein n=1 Tax=Burkholderia guangdongensis TaxID=1792500 RepID=UPI0015CA33CF|nr:glyoxalase [Burkholderia guangdongensis]